MQPKIKRYLYIVCSRAGGLSTLRSQHLRCKAVYPGAEAALLGRRKTIHLHLVGKEKRERERGRGEDAVSRKTHSSYVVAWPSFITFGDLHKRQNPEMFYGGLWRGPLFAHMAMFPVTAGHVNSVFASTWLRGRQQELRRTESKAFHCYGCGTHSQKAADERYARWQGTALARLFCGVKEVNE